MKKINDIGDVVGIVAAVCLIIIMFACTIWGCAVMIDTILNIVRGW